MHLQKMLSVAIGAIALVSATSSQAVVIYSDNFDDNTNTGWTYLDRSGGTAIVTTTGGSGTSPSFAEQNGQLEQTTANYTFPDGTGGPQLGGIALSGSGAVGGLYTISVTMDSLEAGNSNQDQAVVFGYIDEDNFHYVETIASSGGAARVYSVASGVRAVLGSTAISFSHDPTLVAVSVDTAAGDVSINYGGAGDASLATGLTLAAGLNGVGSNNDAYAVDDYSINQIPEPASASFFGLAALAALRRRRW